MSSADEQPDGGRAGSTEPAEQPRRRRHRRATGGTVPPVDPVVPSEPTRSPDDQDTGWGEHTPEDPDDRLRREVPPHW